MEHGLLAILWAFREGHHEDGLDTIWNITALVRWWNYLSGLYRFSSIPFWVPFVRKCSREKFIGDHSNAIDRRLFGQFTIEFFGCIVSTGLIRRTDRHLQKIGTFHDTTETYIFANSPRFIQTQVCHG